MWLLLTKIPKLIDVPRDMEVDNETGPLTEGRVFAQGRPLQGRHVRLAGELILSKAVEQLAELGVLRFDGGEQLRD